MASKKASSQPRESSSIERHYAALRRIRRAEEEVARIYPSHKLKSPVPLLIGQESVDKGMSDALETREAVSGTRIISSCCFLRHNSIRYFDYDNAGNGVPNAELAHDRDFFVSNCPHDLTTQMETLRRVPNGVVR